MSTVSLKPPPLSQLRFGTLDASQEAAEDPDLLTGGFYDYKEAAYGVSVGEAWLLLGPKGAGKTAVFEHLKLDWQDRYDRFFTHWDLRGFPVADVTQIQKDLTPGAATAQASWEFLLLIRAIESLSDDQSVVTSDATNSPPNAFNALLRSLTKTGLTEGAWATRVARWSKSSAKFSLPLVEMGIEVENSPASMLRTGDILKRVLALVSTENRHVIAIDGLDSFFFEAQDEWSSLAGLMGALESLNRFFRSVRLPVTIVAAVRPDIFNVLDASETNKLKPRTIHLDWSALGISAKNHLWHLMLGKAKVSRPELRDIAGQYLSGPMSYGYHNVAEYFMDNTRMLPRDIVALLLQLQRIHGGSSLVSPEQARRVVLEYSREYFEGEIFNNLAGVLADHDPRKMESFRDALRTVPMRIFTFDDIVQELAGDVDPVSVKRLLKQLFEIGGIGIKNDQGSGETYTDFSFRSVNGAGFSTRYKFMLHNALTLAWNRPWR